MSRSVVLVMLLLACPLYADTLIRKDGRRLTGTVTRISNGYSIETAMGTIDVTDDQVAKVYYGDVPADKPPAPHAGPQRSTGPDTVKAQMRSLAPLLAQATDALAAEEYAAARDAFLDAASIDPRSASALEGAALAYMRLGDVTHARDPMEQALLSSPTPERPVVINAAAVELAFKAPMRAAKILRDYLTAHTRELDEPVANMLGTALQGADEAGRRIEYYKNCQEFYAAYNARLEAARPGWRRWGVQWLTSTEFQQRSAEGLAHRQEMKSLQEELDQTSQRLVDAKAAWEQHSAPTEDGHMFRRGARRAQAEYDDAQAAYDELKARYDRLDAALSTSRFPDTIPLVAMDDTTIPPVGAPPAAQATLAAAPHPHRPQGLDRQTGDAATQSAVVAAPIAPPEQPVAFENAPAPHKKVRIYSYAAAFPVTDDLVVTAAAPLDNALDIVLQTPDGVTMKATLVRSDGAGLALLRVTGCKLVPLRLAASFIGGAIGCPGYPDANIFNPAAELINGTANAPAAGSWTVALMKHPRIPGAPLMADGRVVGVELAARNSEIPEIPAVSLEQIERLLADDVKPAALYAADPCAAMLQVTATRDSR